MLELLRMADDVGARPLVVVNAGECALKVGLKCRATDTGAV